MKKTLNRITSHRFLFWLLPILIFLILAGGNLWAWHNTRSLIFGMNRDRAQQAAQRMFIRLGLIYYERAKDLTHLSDVLRPRTPDAYQRFLHDAQGIMSRESSFESIGFVDTSGRIVLSVPEEPHGLGILDRKQYVEHMNEKLNESVTTEPFRIPTEQIVHGILVPVPESNGKTAGSNAVVGLLFLSDIIQSTVSVTLPAGFEVSFKVGQVDVFSTPGSAFSGPHISEKRNIMGTLWSITVYSAITGEIARLHNNNFIRLLLNISASLFASILLALALFSFHKAGKSRRRLKASEERYRRLTENARDMVFRITLPHENYEYVSPAASALTGYSVEDFYSRPHLLKDLVDPEWAGYYEKMFDNFTNGEVEPVYEFLIISKSGKKRWIHLRPVLVRDEQSHPIAVEAIATDITQLKNAMAERDKLIEELEAKNAELERYAYTISHELKTPLITIRGFLGYLEEEAAEGDIRALHQDLLLIQSATDTMQKLLEGLIELTRVGRATEEAEDIPFSSIVQAAVDKHIKMIEERGIEISTDPDMPLVHGNRSELLELVENLLENSIKFMGDQKQPLIRFGRYKEKDETVFYIEDNGMGIDPKYKNRIFGIFTKLDPGTEGAGVGLALAQRIVAYHGGWIRAESGGRGKGLKIVFTLPVIEADN